MLLHTCYATTIVTPMQSQHFYYYSTPLHYYIFDVMTRRCCGCDDCPYHSLSTDIPRPQGGWDWGRRNCSVGWWISSSHQQGHTDRPRRHQAMRCDATELCYESMNKPSAATHAAGGQAGLRAGADGKCSRVKSSESVASLARTADARPHSPTR